MAAKKKKPADPLGKMSPELTEVISGIRERSGDNSAHSGTLVPRFNHTPTGVFALDYATYGGLAEGVFHMFYGWEGSGKTTQALRSVAESQKKYPDKKLKTVFVDMEGTLDPTWAEALGVDMSRVIYIKPDTGEEAVDYCEALLKCEDILYVVLDSVPACIPNAIAERSAEDVTMGKLAALMGVLASKTLKSMRIRSRMGQKFKPTMILINQFRSSMVMMGDPRTLPGGHAIRFLCSTLLEIKKKEQLDRNGEGIEVVSFNEHSFSIKRCKTGNRIKAGEYKMICDPENPLGLGAIDDNKTALSLAKKMGYITGGGASWRVGGVDIKFGKLAAIADYMIANPKQMNILKRAILSDIRDMKGVQALPPDKFLLCHKADITIDQDTKEPAPEKDDAPDNT